MKTHLLIPFIIMALSCNSSTDKKQEDNNPAQKVPEITSEKKKSEDHSLKQNGDYTALFMRKEKDCDRVSRNEMATFFKLNENSIHPRVINYGFCWYDLTLNDGSKNSLGIYTLVRDKDAVIKNINSLRLMETDFAKNNSEGIVLMCDSKDTYFGIRIARGQLFMLNPYYDNGILKRFGSVVEAATKTVTYTEEQKKQRLDNAVAVAKYLLKKYKK